MKDARHFEKHPDAAAAVVRAEDRFVVPGRVGILVGAVAIAVASQLLEVQRTSARMRPALAERPRLRAWLEAVATA